MNWIKSSHFEVFLPVGVVLVSLPGGDKSKVGTGVHRNAVHFHLSMGFHQKQTYRWQRVHLSKFGAYNTSSRMTAVRMTPMPAMRKSPVGPLRLSTHPGTGSFKLVLSSDSNQFFHIFVYLTCTFKLVLSSDSNFFHIFSQFDVYLPC